MPDPLGVRAQSLQFPNLIQRRKPRPVANLASRVLIHVRWIFFSTREPIRFDVLGYRARKGKVTDIASPQKEANCEKVLRLKLTATCWVVICLAVDQTRKLSVRAPQ